MNGGTRFQTLVGDIAEAHAMLAGKGGDSCNRGRGADTFHANCHEDAHNQEPSDASTESLTKSNTGVDHAFV